MTNKLAAVTDLPGIAWYPNGQTALSGAPLALASAIDHQFQTWAGHYEAIEYQFPPFVPAHELARLDYFRSFPHLVTFPVALDPQDANLTRFTQTNPLNEAGEVRLTGLAPVANVMTPAACYHCYIQHQGDTLSAPKYLTTRATCFRREATYAPLERQWSFSMREIVCIGTAEEVNEFLSHYRRHLEGFFQELGLPIEWKAANDPFFNPSRNPKYLLQKLDPVKTEMVFNNHLAIGSINFHRNYFGEAFEMTRNGKDAYTGCVAFGIERWLYAWLTYFGTEQVLWPLPFGQRG